MLSPRDMRLLGERLHARFRLCDEAEFAVEIDPRQLSAETVTALAAIGVNRASLGVQDVNPEVQAAINRRQPFAVVERAATWLRAAGIERLNFDLMYGLPGQTTAGVARSVAAALTLDPARVALFGYAHVPWLKRHQRLIDETTLPDASARAAQLETAAALLQGAGYAAIGLDHFARPDDSLARALAAGRLRRNFQGYTTDDAEALLGLGASAIGSLPAGYVQNAAPLPRYRDAIRQGRLATVRGIALAGDDRLRRAIIERLMCDLAVDLQAIRVEFGVAADSLAPERAALRPLAENGLVELDDRAIRVTAAGRPFVRVVCAAFDRYLGTGAGRHSPAI
jgi:oxygen-independent coproporphyrinogen-3 oxidase